MQNIGIIGGGNMGAAIVGGLFKKYRVTICEKDPARARLLKRKFKVTVADLEPVARECPVIILAVKPQDFEDVLARIKNFVTPQKLIVSIAAGITTPFIEERLGPKTRVIRTMPNMPAMIGEGMTAVARGAHATAGDVRAARWIFSCIGDVVVVGEDLMDAVTAVSGSGPAYVFLFAECFLKAAGDLGLDAKLVEQLVKSTLLGSVHLLTRQKEDAAALRARVTSKGGTTQAAMDVFVNHKILETFQQALKAAETRARELARR